MIPARIQIKFFLQAPETVHAEGFAGLFQKWIQTKALEGLLVDVAEYRHVFEGPGTVLIGHDSDYAIEKRGGRLGLVHIRKHHTDADLQSYLRSALRLGLVAGQLLEAEPTIKPRLKFAADEIEIRFADRLHFPNKVETLDAVQPDLSALFADLYGAGAATFAIAPVDPRDLFTVTVRLSGLASLGELLQPFQVPVKK